MHEAAPVAVEHAQQDHDREQNIDGINCHASTDYTDFFFKTSVQSVQSVDSYSRSKLSHFKISNAN
jgi:hypothetical protein